MKKKEERSSYGIIENLFLDRGLTQSKSEQELRNFFYNAHRFKALSYVKLLIYIHYINNNIYLKNQLNIFNLKLCYALSTRKQNIC